MAKREFHLSDCPVLEREVWTDEDVAVAMDWALALGYEDAAGNEDTKRYHYEADRPPWTDYEPEHVREALENDVDPFAWNPEVEAEFEYNGMGDYYGGHSTREGQALLYTTYGFGTTLGDLVDGWMSELTMGFPGEDDPRWEHLSDEKIKEALESIFVTPYDPDALFDEDADEPENEEDEYEAPVAIVLLTVTTGGLKPTRNPVGVPPDEARFVLGDLLMQRGITDVPVGRAVKGNTLWIWPLMQAKHDAQLIALVRQAELEEELDIARRWRETHIVPADAGLLPEQIREIRRRGGPR